MKILSFSSSLRLAVPILAVAAVAFLASCSKHDDRIDLTSGLPPQLAALLAEADDSTLALYARDVGIEEIINAKRHFEDLILGMSKQDYVRHEKRLYSLQNSICVVLAEEYNYDFYLNDLEFLNSYPPEKRHQLMIMRSNIWALAFDPNLSHEARIDSLISYHNMMVELEDGFGASIAKMTLSDMYSAIGDRNNEKRYIKEASEDFAEFGMHRLTCQSLGVLGTIYEREGKIDSMEMCYQAARDLAIRVRLSDQISRFSYFYARRYIRMGRLALANDLFNEAIELCKTYKGGYYEIRFIFHAMEFYAEYSCWDTVERLLSRARILEKIYDNNRYSKNFVNGNKFIEARLNMAHGDVDKANALFKEIEKPNNIGPHFVNPENHLYYWGKGLLDNGRAEEAIEIIDRGLSRARQKSLFREEVKFLTLKATAEFEKGNIDEAREALERIDIVSAKLNNPLVLEWITRDILCAKIAICEGDQDRALVHVERGLGRLKSFIELMDISVQGYLWINDCNDLRSLIHELTANDPKLGYGAELFWRSLTLDMGKKQEDPRISYALALDAMTGSGLSDAHQLDTRLIEHFGTLACRAMSYLHELDAVHCMYVVNNNHITRFTATSNNVEASTIECTRERLHNLVIETCKSMSGESETNGPSDSIDVRANLSKLGEYLLPDDLHKNSSPDNPRTLLISTEDFLGRVPFETFNIGLDGEYVPLLERFDVAYLRNFKERETTRISNEPGIIIVNSSHAKSLQKRYPFGHELKSVRAEGLAVSTLDENALLLEGLDATKHEIKKRWEKASYIYFASHIHRDPEIPYLSLIPLAAQYGNSSPESGYLDFSDIRSADFGTCDFVVLSGCSSGVPSIATRNMGPSLGDAFLDAGANVVITTFWDVKDEDARNLMTIYIEELDRNGSLHIEALCDARRRLFAEDPGSRESFSWASYAVHTKGLFK